MQFLTAADAARAELETARWKAKRRQAWAVATSFREGGGLNFPFEPNRAAMLDSLIKVALGEGVDVEDWPVSRLRAAISPAN